MDAGSGRRCEFVGHGGAPPWCGGGTGGAGDYRHDQSRNGRGSGHSTKRESNEWRY